jgi:outer membrane protein TolC
MCVIKGCQPGQSSVAGDIFFDAMAQNRLTGHSSSCLPAPKLASDGGVKSGNAKAGWVERETFIYHRTGERMKRFAPIFIIPLLLLAVALTGCTAAHYRKSADTAAYGAIKQKTRLVKNMDPAFTIEQTNKVLLAGLPVVTNVVEYLGADGELERGAVKLGLKDALRIAVRQSRTYQSRKEDLYLSALSLTLARHAFTPIFSAGGQAQYAASTEEDPPLSDHFVEQKNVSADGTVAGSWLLRDVGRISAAFTTDFLRFVSGDPRLAVSSKLSATFVRPLWRNAAFKQEMENLTQAERDLLYALRSFTQFRKDFSVQIATAYYNVLGSRDVARNSHLNLQASRKNADRTRALAQEGRVAGTDLGRQEQQELTAESSWINAVRNYKQSLDNFKIQLGLQVDANIVLDDQELTELKIQNPDLNVDDSIQVAMASRLDYMTDKDRLDDSVRKVKVAENMLKPSVDFIITGSLDSNPNRATLLSDPQRYSWSAGLDVDPGLDRTSERNSYRATLIARNRAARTLEEQEDQIKLQVRDSWRTLDQAKRNYEISVIGVRIAERRVEEQDILSEWGRSNAKDQVDAQNALIDSRNQVTQALVTHTIARLQFWNNLGILYIKNDGQWQEVQNAKND